MEQEMPEISIAEIKNEEVKIIMLLFKVTIDSIPNDADLGKKFRNLFNNIKFD